MSSTSQKKLQIYQRSKPQKQHTPYYRMKQSQTITSFTDNPCIITDTDWLQSRFPHQKPKHNQTALAFQNGHFYTSIFLNNKMIKYSVYNRHLIQKKYHHFTQISAKDIIDSNEMVEHLNFKLGVKLGFVKNDLISGQKEQRQQPMGLFVTSSNSKADDNRCTMQEIEQVDRVPKRERINKHYSCDIRISMRKGEQKIRKSHKKTVFSSKDTNIDLRNRKSTILSEESERLMRNTEKKFERKLMRRNSKEFLKNTKRIPIQKWEVNDSLDITHLELKTRQQKENMRKVTNI